MRSPSTGLLVGLSILFASPYASGQAIFNADFDAQPLGPLGTQPYTDPTPLSLPHAIIRDDPSCRADVVASAGNLASRPVHIAGSASGLTSLAFANPTLIDSGRWRVSFDWLALTANNDNSPEQNQFRIVGLNGNVLSASFGLKFDTTGHYQVQDSTGFHQINAFTLGVSDHIDFDFDVATRAYTLQINGVQRSSGTVIGSNFFSTSFASNGRPLPFDPIEFAIDNVVVVPEPAAASLLAVGGCVFFRRRRRRG